MEAFNNIVTAINGVVWGPIMLVLLIGTHVLLTIRTKGIQRKTNRNPGKTIQQIRNPIGKHAG